MTSTHRLILTIFSLSWCLPASAEVLPIQDPLVKNAAPNILENPVENGQVQIAPVANPLTEFSPSNVLPNPALAKPHLQQVRQALINSNQRYPFLVSPLGKVQSRLNLFTPSQRPRNTSINLNIAPRQITIDDLTTAKFPADQQLYWVLPGNRIVIETKGTVATVDFQGQAIDRTIVQKVKATQALWGLQSVWLLPQALQDLVSEDKFQQGSILSIAGEVNNPIGADPVTINLNAGSLDSSPTRTILPFQTPQIGTGSTSSSQGGGSLFEPLTVANGPLVLQAFPTTNLQVLLEGEGLFKGARVSPALLAKAGIEFGNPFTGEGFKFSPVVTSIPGIKIARADRFDNSDLLNVLINPFISAKQRQLDYLNSLNWLSLGVRTPEILSTTTTDVTQDWYQVKLSRPHNRTLLQYEATPGHATYYNLFVNPGVALDFSLDAKRLNMPQSVNASVGALMGGLFGLIHPFRLEKSVWEARLQYNREEAFKPLRTQTTPEQRQQINQRLDRALNIAQLNSGITQLSGSITLPTALTPTSSDMFQIRAGNYQRQIQFADVNAKAKASEIFISKISLSDQTFGPLKTIGIPVPQNLTSVTPNNRVSRVKTIVTSADGQESFELSNDLNLTAVPIGVRTFDSAFDRIELSQIGTVTTLIKSFDGNIQMPAIEILWQRSRGPFNYALSTGMWLNLARDTAPNVERNRIGPKENPIGMYTNAAINWSKSGTTLKLDKSLKQIRTQIATAQFAWNTASNASNPTYLNLNYSYLHQTPKFNWTSTLGVFLAAYNQRVEPISFWRNQLGLRSGLDVISSVEKKTTSTNLLFEAIQSIGPRWSLGLYAQNFRSSPGLNRRIVGQEKGLIIKHRSPRGNTWQARLNLDQRNWSLQIQSNLNF
jgi:hypothetical protein